MVSVGVSRMGKTGIVFVEPEAKDNSEYFYQHVLGGGLLPDIRDSKSSGRPRPGCQQVNVQTNPTFDTIV